MCENHGCPIIYSKLEFPVSCILSRITGFITHDETYERRCKKPSSKKVAHSTQLKCCGILIHILLITLKIMPTSQNVTIITIILELEFKILMICRDECVLELQKGIFQFQNKKKL